VLMEVDDEPGALHEVGSISSLHLSEVGASMAVCSSCRFYCTVEATAELLCRHVEGGVEHRQRR
jgi:hypothetical protein